MKKGMNAHIKNLTRVNGNISGNGQRGSVILLTLLILTTVTVIVLSSSTLVMQGLKASKNQENSTIAYFAAETGAERILWENRKNGYEFTQAADIELPCQENDYITFNTDPIGCVPDSSPSITHTLSNGASYRIKYSRFDIATNKVYLLCTGTFMGVTRSVEISYQY